MILSQLILIITVDKRRLVVITNDQVEIAIVIQVRISRSIRYGELVQAPISSNIGKGQVFVIMKDIIAQFIGGHFSDKIVGLEILVTLPCSGHLSVGNRIL